MRFEEKHHERRAGQWVIDRTGKTCSRPAGSLLLAFKSFVKRRCRWEKCEKNLWLMPLLLVFFVAGCATVSFPPINLKNPGWTVRQGQAIWYRRRGGEGIAGDILVATRPNGRAFVQFSKNPFPIAIAQSSPKAWSIEFPPENKHYSGHGSPPQRIILLQLPRVLTGLPPPPGWSWRKLGNGGWRLENQVSGESLDVYFNP
jgi:hypothetical protein